MDSSEEDSVFEVDRVEDPPTRLSPSDDATQDAGISAEVNGRGDTDGNANPENCTYALTEKQKQKHAENDAASRAINGV